MKERLKKILSVSLLKITVFVILVALTLFFIDAPFLRFMELKSLDLRMISRGQIRRVVKRSSWPSMRRA